MPTLDCGVGHRHDFPDERRTEVAERFSRKLEAERLSVDPDEVVPGRVLAKVTTADMQQGAEPGTDC